MRARGRRGRRRRARSSPATSADAVLGGGGYVAGPVGLAALTRRIPVVLTEADSHLGLTNRLLAPRAAPRLPRVPDRGARGRALPRHRPPGAADGRATARRARAAFGIPPDADLRARVRRLARRALDQPRRGRGVRRRALPRPPRPRRPRLRRAPRSRASTTTCASTSTRSASALAAADLAVARAGGSRVRARPVRPAGDPDPVSARLRRPPDRQRALDGRRRRRHDPARRRADARSGCARRSTSCSPTPSGSPRWPPPRARLAPARAHGAREVLVAARSRCTAARSRSQRGATARAGRWTGG